VIVAAVAAGFFMLSYDQRTDDTGVMPITAWSIMNGNSGGIAALAFALVGAGVGWLMRRGSLLGR